MYKSIVVLTGAGISAESGIKTFRDKDGLWEGHSVLEVATPEAFQKNPKLVNRFYNERRTQLLGGRVHPNQAHQALANFETKFNGNFLLITQNVDDLHERAGSKSVLHMHGSLIEGKCNACNYSFEILQDINYQDICSKCSAQSTLRPDIVWFGEIPKYMDQIEQRISDCDLFISIGTSAEVYPAAGFSDFARQIGAKTVELNLAPSSKSNDFDESILGLATKIVPQFFESLELA